MRMSPPQHQPHRPLELAGLNQRTLILPLAPRTADNQHHCPGQPPVPLYAPDTLRAVNSTCFSLLLGGTHPWLLSRRQVGPSGHQTGLLALESERPVPQSASPPPVIQPWDAAAAHGLLEAPADCSEDCPEHRGSPRPGRVPWGNPPFCSGTQFPCLDTRRHAPYGVPQGARLPGRPKARMCLGAWLAPGPSCATVGSLPRDKRGAARP